VSIKVAINGYGRIGRNVLRALYESDKYKNISIVAINDLGDAHINAHLTEYDTVHGRFSGTAVVDKNDKGAFLVNGDRIQVLSERDPSLLPWKELAVDVVLECTGFFTKREAAMAHIKAGAKKVIISAPSANADATIVYGVNHDSLTKDDTIISNASCTTNCLAPMAKVLNDSVGIVKGQMTTIHSYTNDQQLTDVYHTDLYRARSATQSMIPTKTGAASAVGLVLPELNGKLDGMAMRVPTINVSLVDFTFIAERETSVEEVNELMLSASHGFLKGVLECNDKPLVSTDFNHNPASCCFDINQTKVDGNFVKVMAWYDNEWGFSNRMLDTITAVCSSAKIG
jgi:glyceraldehyde 3-phosphate dehydrogenase